MAKREFLLPGWEVFGVMRVGESLNLEVNLEEDLNREDHGKT
jgi:hypothetical protein